IFGEIESGKSRTRFIRTNHLVLKIVLGCAPNRAADDCAVGGSDHESTVDCHQRLPRRLLQLRPELICALDERNVQRVLEIHLADYPAVAMRRAHAVRRFELLDSKYAPAPAR